MSKLVNDSSSKENKFVVLNTKQQNKNRAEKKEKASA